MFTRHGTTMTIASMIVAVQWRHKERRPNKMIFKNVFPQGSFVQDVAGFHETLVGIRLMYKHINMGRISSASKVRDSFVWICMILFFTCSLKPS